MASLPVVTTLVGATLIHASGPADPETPERSGGPDFNREIRPILARCLPCHGPDAASRSADLRLDERADAIRDRRGGAAIVPGEGGSILARVTSDDPDLVMPPPGNGQPLTPEEVETLRRWIGAGAEYDLHWAWVPPDRTATPPEAPGPEWASTWPRRDLDRHVAADLLAHGLEPAPEADLPTLARRAALDLTGLPPTLLQLDELLDDAATDDPDAAWDRYVDRLLASPAFGERWARVWLDVARYADTKGYEADRRRTMWPWRDWVVRAFNADMPFDRFTMAQLAGDLMPGHDEDDVLATAFHRNTMTNDEGGTRDEEFRMAAVVDRTNTTLAAWMGLTAECAACHDHKYDPLSTREYYELLAFFNTTQDADRNDERPLLDWLPPEARAARDAANSERNSLLAEIDARIAAGDFDDASSTIPAGVIPILGDQRPPGATPLDEIVAGDLPWDDAIEPPPGWQRARRSQAGPDAVRQHHFNDVAPPARIVVAEGDRLAAWVRLDPANPPAEVMVQVHAEPGQWEHRAYWGANLNPWGVDGTDSRRRLGDLPESGTWVRLEWEAADIGLDPGHVITGVACTQYGDADGGVMHWGPVSVLRPEGDPPAWLVDPDAWIDALASVKGRGLPTDLRPLPAAALKGDEAARATLRARWRRTVSPTGIAATRDAGPGLASLDATLAEIGKRRIAVPVLRSQDPMDARTTHVLAKGDWRSPEEVVDPGVPAFLHPLPSDVGDTPDRLALARWIVDDRNPLTARVHVNRVWERMFGLGLVETQEDFGTQGNPPSNQGLLDHLAVRFMDDLDWSHKALCREIATSATYRQSSATSPEALATDPRNERLARGPRFRLEAEAIRDAALAASGRLTPTVGGPPVFPPQPDGVWQVVYSGDAWRTADGPDRHRRSLYTFWRRTAPHPAMTTLDAGSRETCAVRRIRTNTPLQALVLLNDDTFVEAAGGLALRMLEAGPDVGPQVARGFRLVTGRLPDDRETRVLADLLARTRARFAGSPEDATALIDAARVSPPAGVDAVDLAARIVVANVLLNLDEFLTRG